MYDAVPFQVRCTWQIAVCLCRNTKVRCLQFNGNLYCSPECLRMATKEEDDKVVLAHTLVESTCLKAPSTLSLWSAPLLFHVSIVARMYRPDARMLQK